MGRAAASPNGFTFVAPPAVTTVSPSSGPSAGGTAVTLTGTDFTTGATVTFGGVAATNVMVVSATSITLTTPAHSAGAVTVVVTNPDGQIGSLANGFTFVAPPAVTTVSPTSGPSAGGTAVTLTGTDFTTGATVTIGGVAATNVVVVSATSITLTTPAHSAGAVTVVVTNPDGQSGSLANGFTFVAPPAVTTVSPTSGPSAGGTAVTLTGTDFTTGATVTFGGVAATNVIVVSATSITLTTPAHSAGAVTVVVTNPDGQIGEPAERLHVYRAADSDDRQSRVRPVGRRHGGDAHRHRLHDRGDGDVRRRGGDQCGGGERDLDHADHARAQRRGRHGRGDQSGWADRKPRERLHVRRAAGGDDGQSHLRPVGRRHSGDAHRHGLHDRGHGHVRRRRRDQCDGGERDFDHADHGARTAPEPSRSW